MQKTTNHDAKAETLRFAVITLSDKGYRGEREDTSGRALTELLGTKGYQLCHYSIIPDNIDVIVKTVKAVIVQDKADLVLTTGGTGVSPTDVTPEAMDQLIEKEIPGIAEAMRAASMQVTSRAMLSRGRAGIREKSLIINLPGSKKGALENIEVVLPALEHAVEKIKGSTVDCGLPEGQ